MIKLLVLTFLTAALLGGAGCGKRIREADAPRQGGEVLAQR